MNSAEFLVLTQRLLDGERLSPTEFAAVELELLESPGARREWRKFASLHSALEVHHASQIAVNKSRIVPINRVLARQRARIVRIALTAAAAVILVSGFGLWLMLAPKSAVVAKLTVAPGSDFSVVHSEPDSSTGRHTLSEGSRLDLNHGVAELDLPHDVRAVVQAPARATLIDARTLRLDHGSAFFEVSSPEGKGFTVVTPHQRIVDLGTAFGIEAPAGRREVGLHVFQGKVRADTPDGTSGEILTAPRAVILDGTALTRELEPSDGAFLRALPDKVETLLWDDFETGLNPLSGYAITIDPALILDSSGNGFGENTPWTFRTGLPAAVEVRNPGFEEDGKIVSKGEPISHWKSVAHEDWGWGTDMDRENLGPTRGAYFGRLFGGNAIAQTLNAPITAGTSYVLTLDVAVLSGSSATVRMFGSDRGFDTALAETTITSPASGWLRDRTLHFTATEAYATGQTLGISLHCASGTAMFDHIRLQAFGPGETRIEQPEFPPSVASTDDDAPRAPVLLARSPAEGVSGVDPNGTLTLIFDRPIKLGTGRVILRNTSESSETVVSSGSPRMSVSGKVLEIQPPGSLGHGETRLGVLPGWELAAPAGLHNPADGVFNDRAGKRPVRHIATVVAGAPGSGIRRGIGGIEQGRHYTASLAIGHRKTSGFSGYRIRFLSGGVVLAEHTVHTPPGPPGSVESAGLLWKSADLPAGIAPGDPLVLEIAPARGEAHGVLDIDNVRVTSVSDRH